MPRAPDGTYTQPLPDVNPGEIVSSTWANTTIADISQALTDSLDRNGNGGMNVPFTFGDGTMAAPGISWSNETATGFYRAATGDMRVAVLGQDLFRWNSGNAQLWDDVGMAWVNVLVDGGSGTVPDGAAVGNTLVWNGTGWDATTLAAGNVAYDPIGDTVITATDVQAALGEIDVVLAEYNAHAADTTIHFADVPIDDVVYNRRNGAWIPSVTGVSVHDQLQGLTNDDHPQYHNDSRGDLRYPQLTDYDAHVADTSIHFADAPSDGSPYARQDAGWVNVGGGATPMVGEIRLFHGNLSNLQFGWYLCDGNNGTPDMTGRVAFGAGGAYAEGVSAGTTAVTRNTASAGSHSHSVGIQSQYSNAGATGGDHTHNPTSATVQAGTGATVAAFAQVSFQGSDHSHPVVGATATTGSHSHELTDADPPHYVVTGYIMYTGV